MFKENSNVIVCRTSNSTRHYFIQHYLPQLINPAQPSIGITNSQVYFKDGQLVCSFTRMDKMNFNKLPLVANYHNFNASSMFLFTYGSGDCLNQILNIEFVYSNIYQF